MALPPGIGNVGADVGGSAPGFTPQIPQGDPIGRGLRVLGQKLQARAKEAEQTMIRAERSNALTDLAKLETSLSIELDQLRRDQNLSGLAYTKAATDLVKRRTETFVSNYPENVRAELKPRIAALQGKHTLKAYTIGVEGAGKQYLQNINETLTLQKELLLKGEKTLEEAKQDVEKLLAESPLLPEATQALQQSAEKELELLDLQRTSKDIAFDQTAPLGIPPVGWALLDTIASTEARDYNILYGNDTFSDFSKHPNIKKYTPDNVPTTAAGRYQFLSSTWQRVAEAIKAEDFSPPNQDKGAWWLAQADYRQRTGRELLADLQSGRPDRLAEVKKFLEPTWEGLSKISTEEFIRRYTHAASSTIPDEILSERYRNVPVEQRVQTWLASQGEAQNAALAATRAADFEKESQLQELETAIISGEAGLPEISQAAETFSLSPTEIQGLQAVYQKANADIIATQQIEQTVANGQPLVGFNQNAVEAWAKRVLLEEYSTGNVDSVAAKITTARSVPETILAAAIADLQSTQIESKAKGANLLASLQQFNLLKATDLPVGVSKQLTAYQTLSRYMPPAEAIAQAFPSDPRVVEVQDKLRAQGEQLVRKKLTEKEISPQQLVDAVGEGGIIFSQKTDPMLSMQLMQEFLANYPQAFALTGDDEKATDLATQWLKQRWGVTSLGGSDYLVPLPPEKVYPAQADSGLSWVEQQVRETFGLLEDDNFVLLPAPETEFEIKKARQNKLDRLPSYAVALVDEDGVINPIMDETGRPRLFYPEPAQVIEQNLNRPTVIEQRAATETWRLMADRTDLNEAEARIVGTRLGQLTQTSDKVVQQTAKQLYKSLRKGQANPEKLARFVLDHTSDEQQFALFGVEAGRVRQKLEAMAAPTSIALGSPPENPSELEQSLLEVTSYFNQTLQGDTSSLSDQSLETLVSAFADTLELNDSNLSEPVRQAIQNLPEDVKTLLEEKLTQRNLTLRELLDAGN